MPALPPSSSLACLALLALSATAPLRAALEWSETTRLLELKPFQTTAELVFPFRNTGSAPVAIVDLQTNCDCLTATTDKTRYAPGERGQLQARFAVGDRFGLYERTVTVHTDEPGPARKIVVRLNMPAPATTAPRTVEWKAGTDAPSASQTVLVQVADGLHIDFTEAVTTNPDFQVSLTALEAGRRYELRVQPVSLAKPTSTAIRIRGRERSGHDVIVSAYANVN